MQTKIDWLAGTLPIRGSAESTARSLIDKLASINDWFFFDRWSEKGTSLNYYSSVLLWGGKTNCHIAWNDLRPEMRVYFQMSGTVIDSIGYEQTADIIKMLIQNDFIASRIDLALDVNDEQEFPIQQMRKSLRLFSHQDKKTLVSRIKRENVRVAGAGWFDGSSWENWTLGSRNGNIYFRFYDKKVEQKIRRDDVESMIKSGSIPSHDAEYMRKKANFWYRIEAEIKHNHAKELLSKLTHPKMYNSIMASVMDSNFRFIEHTDDSKHANDKDSVNWWKTFIETLNRYYFV